MDSLQASQSQPTDKEQDKLTIPVQLPGSGTYSRIKPTHYDIRDQLNEVIVGYKRRIEGLEYFLSGLPPKPEPIPEAAEDLLREMLNSGRW